MQGRKLTYLALIDGIQFAEQMHTSLYVAKGEIDAVLCPQSKRDEIYIGTFKRQRKLRVKKALGILGVCYYNTHFVVAHDDFAAIYVCFVIWIEVNTKVP